LLIATLNMPTESCRSLNISTLRWSAYNTKRSARSVAREAHDQWRREAHDQWHQTTHTTLTNSPAVHHAIVAYHRQGVGRRGCVFSRRGLCVAVFAKVLEQRAAFILKKVQ
jgi:hypothetical protein